MNRPKLNYFLGGGLQTEQNLNIFWVVGYKQKTVSNPLMDTQLDIYIYIEDSKIFFFEII